MLYVALPARPPGDGSTRPAPLPSLFDASAAQPKLLGIGLRLSVSWRPRRCQLAGPMKVGACSCTKARMWTLAARGGSAASCARRRAAARFRSLDGAEAPAPDQGPWSPEKGIADQRESSKRPATCLPARSVQAGRTPGRRAARIEYCQHLPTAMGIKYRGTERSAPGSAG